jgi:hypothetical protein
MWRRRPSRRRRLGARHAHRRHRPQLSLPAQGMEVPLSAGCRVPRRVADRDDGLQDAAGALGQGTDPVRHQGYCRSVLKLRRLSTAREDRGLVSPDGEPQLSADDRPLRALMPAMIIRFYQGWFQMLYIDLPLFMASTFSISSFYSGFAEGAVSPGAGIAPSSTCPS